MAAGTQVIPGEAEKKARYLSIPIEKLEESKRNPRKFFAKDALSDLTKSIAEKGILNPLLVRPIEYSDKSAAKLGTGSEKGGLYEILAGARRYRAAKAAGLKEAPCIVRELDDDQALEVMIIDNLQRENVHPLEEADGYKQLLAKGKYDVEALAAKVAKSVSYIYQRLKLAELAPAAKNAFEEEKITAGHAILLARLQPAQQTEGLKECLDRYHKPSVRDLAEWIERNVHLDLAKAPWQKDDEKLVPAAGACTKCPKRTGANASLFPEIKKADTCTDPQCYRGKMKALIQIKQEQDATALLVSTDYAHSGNKEKALKKDFPGVLLESEYRAAGTKKCASTKNALIVDGDGAGTFMRICLSAKCKTHRDPYACRPQQRSAKQIAADKAAAERRAFDEKVENAAFVAAVGKVKAMKTLPVTVWRLIAKGVVFGYYGETELVSQALGVKGDIEKAVTKCKPSEIPAFLFAVAASADNGGLSSKEQREAVKLAGVDAAAIRSKLTAEAKAAAKVEKGKTQPKKAAKTRKK